MLAMQVLEMENLSAAREMSTVPCWPMRIFFFIKYHVFKPELRSQGMRINRGSESAAVRIPLISRLNSVMNPSVKNSFFFLPAAFISGLLK